MTSKRLKDIKIRDLGALSWMGLIVAGIGGFMAGFYLRRYLGGAEWESGVLLGFILIVLGLILLFFDLRRILNPKGNR